MVDEGTAKRQKLGSQMRTSVGSSAQCDDLSTDAECLDLPDSDGEGEVRLSLGHSC